jgi:hypothetical protein
MGNTNVADANEALWTEEKSFCRQLNTVLCIIPLNQNALK